MLAAALTTLVWTASVSAATFADRTGDRYSSSSTVKASTKKPAKTTAAQRRQVKLRAAKRRATQRRVCVATNRSPSLRGLSRTQRTQLRQYSAYRVPARKARKAVRFRKATRGLRAIKARKATPGRKAGWVCTRTARQTKTVAKLTSKLGAATTSRDILAVDMPATLDKPLMINATAGSSAGWRMLDVPKAPAQLYERGAVYSTGEYDVVQEVSFGSLKEAIAIHAKQGTRTWRWKLDWKGGTEPYLAPDGTV
ncbi:MAG: hypothetical protein ABI200_06360, partial [Gaiellales bacterium]